jgi:rhodanese-related sulfurtransferase
MTPEDAQGRTDLHLLDVREPGEWQAGHIAGSQHIPLGQLRERLGEVPKDQTILTVCRSGNRSEAAARGLRTLGYTVENLEGGATAWTRAGLPLEADGGGPGRVI